MTTPRRRAPVDRPSVGEGMLRALRRNILSLSLPSAPSFPPAGLLIQQRARYFVEGTGSVFLQTRRQSRLVQRPSYVALRPVPIFVSATCTF